VTPRLEIREALIEIAPLYENARVKSFVPIFLRRDVLQRLQNGVVQTHRAEKPKLVKGWKGAKEWNQMVKKGY
jgi:hypothetical protein